MFSELPKLFDRNFAIGFFLPVAIFITLSYWIAGLFGLAPDINAYLDTNLLIGTTILGLIAWVGGIVLLAINRDLYRILEGYGTYNPLRVFTPLQVWKYRRLVDELEKLDDEYRLCIEKDVGFPKASEKKRDKILITLAEEFPDKAEYVLPTAFGNVLRSFEVYPRVMYGMDSIYMWGRLLSVIPKDSLALMDEAKAQVDFWINLGLVFIVLLVQYEVLALGTNTSLNTWIFLLLFTVGTIAPLRATSAAKEWGDFVKSVFDTYRSKLLESMDIDLPRDREKEKILWTRVSQAIIFRDPDSLPDLKKAADREEKSLDIPE